MIFLSILTISVTIIAIIVISAACFDLRKNIKILESQAEGLIYKIENSERGEK